MYNETWGKPDIVYFISIAHEVMGRDQWLEDDDPIGVLRPLNQQIGQLRNGNIGLVGAMQQICNRPEKNKNFNAINKTTTKMKIKQRNPDINYPFICFHPDFPHYYELKKKVDTRDRYWRIATWWESSYTNYRANFGTACPRLKGGRQWVKTDNVCKGIPNAPLHYRTGLLYTPHVSSDSKKGNGRLTMRVDV